MSHEKLDELAQLVAEFQAKLGAFEVQSRERVILGILADLLTNIDIASRDIYWAKKDLDEPNIYVFNERR